MRLILIALDLNLSQLVGQASDRGAALCELDLCLFKLPALILVFFVQSFYSFVSVSLDLLDRDDLPLVVLTLHHSKLKLRSLLLDHGSLLVDRGFRLTILLLIHLRLALQALNLFLF